MYFSRAVDLLELARRMDLLTREGPLLLQRRCLSAVPVPVFRRFGDPKPDTCVIGEGLLRHCFFIRDAVFAIDARVQVDRCYHDRT